MIFRIQGFCEFCAKLLVIAEVFVGSMHNPMPFRISYNACLSSCEKGHQWQAGMAGDDRHLTVTCDMAPHGTTRPAGRAIFASTQSS